MSKPLSTDEPKRLDPAKFNSNKYDDNSTRGCVLEVHMEHPKELHKLHNEHHLAPDKLKIKSEMLPDYQRKIADN